MKFAKILLCLLMVSFISKGQDYSVEATFVLKEPRLLVFNEENKLLHDSLVTSFKLSNTIIQKDSIKMAGLVSYTEGGNRIFILRLNNPAMTVSFKQNLTSQKIESFELKNDLSWAIEKIKFDYLVSIINFIEPENLKIETLIKQSKATYGGINMSKLRYNIENNLIEYKEFMY